MPEVDVAIVGVGAATKALAGLLRRAGLSAAIRQDVWHAEAGILYAPDRLRFRQLVIVPETVVPVMRPQPIPDNNLAWALGCTHDWDETARCWRTRTDAAGRTSRDGVWIAAPSPELTARAVAADLGRIEAAGAAAPLPAAAPAPPVGELRFDDDALVCRCEGVTLAAIVKALGEGCAGPNQVKAFTRCGMGACQGRACGAGLTEIIAARTGRRPAEIGYFRIRMPLRPVALGAIADSDA